MPRYRYTAVDLRGEPVSGELEAAGPRQALEALAARGLDAESVCLSEVLESGRRGGWLSTEEAVELAAQLAQLTKAGLPLAGGLRALAKELPGGRLRQVLREISRQLEAGATLEAAIKAQGPRFPAHVRGFVLAGARSGRLAEVLEEFVDVQRNQAELRRRVWLSLAYPALLLLLLSLLFILLQDYLLPQFDRIFKDFDAELPVLTQLFLQTSGTGTWLLEIGIVLLVGALALSWAMPRAVWAPRVLYAVPLIGPLWRWSRLVQFSRLMGVLLEQKVPLPEALRLAAAGLREADLASGCRQVAEELEAGRSLSESLSSRRQFPATLIPLVEWGQRSSALADAFRAAAEMFEGRVRTQGVFLETILAPITFLFITAMVAFFITAMFVPMVSLIQALT